MDGQITSKWDAPRAGVVFTLIGAILWSTGGVAVKVLPFPELAISAGRSILAGLLFLILAKGDVIPPKGTRLWFLMGAFTYAYVVTAYVISTRWTTAANAILLQYTSPLWIIAFGKPLLGETPKRRDLISLALGAAGVVFCLKDGFSLPGEGQGLLTKQTWGDLIALSSGIMFGFCTMILRKVSRGADGAVASSGQAARLLFAGNMLAALVGAPALVGAMQGAASTPAIAWAGLLWLGIGQLGLGYFFFQRGARSLPALQISVISLTEPVLNPIWVALAVGEIPAPATWVGGGLVLAAMIVNMLGTRRKPA